MADENTELLREIAALLKQSAEQRRKAVGEAVDTLRGRKGRQEAMNQRMHEARDRAEQHRREQRVFNESMLSELRKISSLLEQLQRRSGGAG
jgi:hypothetical protein